MGPSVCIYIIYVCTHICAYTLFSLVLKCWIDCSFHFYPLLSPEAGGRFARSKASFSSCLKGPAATLCSWASQMLTRGFFPTSGTLVTVLYAPVCVLQEGPLF